MVKKLIYKSGSFLTLISLLWGCNTNQLKNSNSLEEKIHQQNCTNTSLVRCAYLLTNDFMDAENFIGNWYESYFRMPHIPMSFQTLYPYLDNNSQGKPKLAVIFWKKPVIEDCARYQCDRKMEMSFHTKENLSVKEFVKYFGPLQVDSEKSVKNKEDFRSNIYWSSNKQQCIYSSLWVNDDRIGSIAMYLYPRDVCEKVQKWWISIPSAPLPKK